MLYIINNVFILEFFIDIKPLKYPDILSFKNLDVWNWRNIQSFKITIIYSALKSSNSPYIQYDNKYPYIKTKLEQLWLINYNTGKYYCCKYFIF